MLSVNRSRNAITCVKRQDSFSGNFLVRSGTFKVLDQCGGQTIDDIFFLGDNVYIPIRIGTGRGKIGTAPPAAILT